MEANNVVHHDRCHQGYALIKFYFSSTANDTVAGRDNKKKETKTMTFIDKNGDEEEIKVLFGMLMLEAAHKKDIELEYLTWEQLCSF